jgi:uncharacterized protein
MKTIWFDIDNTPHVNFFKPLINHLKVDYRIIFTLKEFAEVKKLFENEIGLDYKMIGRHKGGLKIMKVYGVFERTLQLLAKMERFDLKISIGGDSSNLCAKIRGKKSITFDDNETAPNWRYSKFTDFAFWPSAIPLEIILNQGFKKSKVFRYNGFKENIYIADYSPDPEFLNKIPFKNYVVVRPENILANYVDSNKTIVPELVDLLLQEKFNILFLPRYEHDYRLVKNNDNVFVPSVPLNGLDVCYYADVVLTGAGTIAREAACMGTPAISFYAGSKLLLVDQALIKEGKMIHSRNPSEIVINLKKMKKNHINLEKSKETKEEVFAKVDKLLENWF